MDPALNCLDCEASLQGRHPNARYCRACAEDRKRQPPSNLTAAQGEQLPLWRKRLTRSAMAERLGVSRATVNRYFREQGIGSNALRYPREVVETVLAVYVQHGRIRTQELFPEVQVRSIVERYNPPNNVLRQVPWKEHEIIEAARMAGLVSANAQARYFNRPNAFDGSILALWNKVFQCAPSHVNGLGVHLAFRLVRPGSPCLMVEQKQSGGVALKVLWLQMVGQLRPDCPDWIKQAIQTLAHFQAWLHNTSDPTVIAAMIAQRELS